MKKHVIAVFVGVITFLLGCAFVVDYFIAEKQEVRVPEEKVAESAVRVNEPSAGCKNPATFPGRSLELTDLKKFKHGYFPEKAFNDGWDDADAGTNQWYGQFLRVMNESSLLNIDPETEEVYRFLWLRTFHRPVSVRLERDGNHIALTAVELSGSGGYESGKKYRTDHVVVSIEEWCEFIRLLDASAFWSRETVDRSRTGLDGSQWILEGVKERRYHIVDRWRPDEGSYRDACLYLLKLSGRDPKTLGSDLY